MSEIRELAAGQQASLPGKVLRARLTDAVGGVRLKAVTAQGTDVTFRRVDDATLLVHPDAGSVRLVASPVAAEAFVGGTRLGIDVRVEGAQIDAQPVLIGAIDVGALSAYELARLDLAAGVGWTMVASGGPVTAGVSLERGVTREPTTASSALDEQQYPWISAGRYAFRSSRGGNSSFRVTAEPWALVLDGSISMRTVFNSVSLAELVDLVAGILSEWTGRIPIAATATGLNRPVAVDGAAARPAALVASVMDRSEPPSWSIITPAVAHAVELGARFVAVVTDGAPADTSDLAAYIGSRPEVQLLVVAAGRSAFSLPSDRVAGTEELGALADLGSAPNVRVVAVDPATAHDDRRGIELANAITVAGV